MRSNSYTKLEAPSQTNNKPIRISHLSQGDSNFFTPLYQSTQPQTSYQYIDDEMRLNSMFPPSSSREERTLQTITPSPQANFLETVKQKKTFHDYIDYKEDSFEYEESVNENKEEIETTCINSCHNPKLLKDGKTVYFNQKMQQFNRSKNKSIHFVQQPGKEINASTNDQSGLSFVFRSQLGSLGEKHAQASMASLANLKKPEFPQQRSFNEFNDLFDGTFSNDECDEYDKLDRTAKMNMERDLFINSTVRTKEAGETLKQMMKPGRIFNASKFGVEEGGLTNVLGGLDDENGNSYISKERMKCRKQLSTLAEMEDKSYSEILTRAIFNHDLRIIKKVLRKREFPIDLNVPDALGNTPLMLAIKLSFKHADYIEIAKCLISYGAKASVKDHNGWTCLDEAVSQANYKMIAVILDSLMEKKKLVLIKQKDELLQLLDKTPNFYLEMKWDFESNLIPFVSKLAPSDTFKIWKFGRFLRMDYTLTGFKGLKSKRRNMSLLFNPSLELPNGLHSVAPLFSLNRDKNQYTNNLQDIDSEEKKCMICDLLKAEPMQGSLDIKNCAWSENKGMFGTHPIHKVNEWDTKKFDFKLTMEYSMIKKAKALFGEDHETYINSIENSKKDRASTARTSLMRGKEDKIMERAKKMKEPNSSRSNSIRHTTKEKIFSPNYDQDSSKTLNESTETADKARVKEKKSSGSIWLAQGFPLNMKDFLPVLEFLSKGNNLLTKLESLISHEDSKKIITDGNFPVKLQVPLTLSIKANVTMMSFKNLEKIDIKDTFFLPADCVYVNRKEAQKTLTRPKKRMILVNTLI